MARVEPIWVDWMTRWPTPSAFAAASRADVLRARFARAFPNGVPARVDMAAKVRDAVAAACARYGVPVDATRTGVDRHGERYTLIGRLNNRVAVTVDHATARCWNSPMSRFETTARLGLVK